MSDGKEQFKREAIEAGMLFAYMYVKKIWSNKLYH